jgi:hypothetical protein
VATATTVAGLFSTELLNLPLASSSDGFVYRLDPGLGVVSRVSDAFEPFFTERVLRNSKGQGWLVSLPGVGVLVAPGRRSGESGTFPANAARFTGATQDFSVDTLELELDNRSVTVFASYGITDRSCPGRRDDAVAARRSRGAGDASGLDRLFV